MVMEIAGNNDGSIGDYIIIEYAECGPHKKLRIAGLFTQYLKS